MDTNSIRTFTDNEVSGVNINHPDTPTSDKRPRVHTIFARVTNISSSSKKKIHVSINSYLPFVILHLGKPEDDKNRILIRVNTGTAINTGKL